MQHLTLSNLSEEDVNALISDSLQCAPADSQELSQLVYTKTAGNAFFTHQTLYSLNEKNLLTFDMSTRHWRWDLAALQTIDIADNVIELMASKVQRLPIATQEVMKLAACIDIRFDLETLSIITHISKEN